MVLWRRPWSTSARMAPALKAAGARVVHQVYPGLDHYAMNLAQGEPGHDWVKTARYWLHQS